MRVCSKERRVFLFLYFFLFSLVFENYKDFDLAENF